MIHFASRVATDLTVGLVVVTALLLYFTTAHVHGAKLLRLLRCPLVHGTTNSFSLPFATQVTIKKRGSNNKKRDDGSLCTLALEQPDDNDGATITLVPVARAYNGNDWERAGGNFAASVGEWKCTPRGGCTATLPKGAKYVLLLRRAAPPFKLLTVGGLFLEPPATESTSNNAEVARFLEAASFGATPEDLTTWGKKTFAQYIQEQFAMEPTMHREYFRRRANPRWTCDHPEFAASLDPCAEGSTWRRHVLTGKDRDKIIKIRRVGDRWELTIDGVVRSMLPQLRFVNPTSRDVIVDRGSYKYCSRTEESQRGIHKANIDGRGCRQLESQDLIIDFPAGYVPVLALQGVLPALSNVDSWQRLSSTLPEYQIKTTVDSTQCTGLPEPIYPVSPIFAKTEDGKWMQHDPRIVLNDNSLESPQLDGGSKLWLTNRTSYCSNVPRSFLNEASCVMTSQVSCQPGESDQNTVAAKGIVCGSPGEIANNLNVGDSWLDIASISVARTLFVKLPTITTSIDAFSRQRELIWSNIALTSKDQLRQRMALALLHIFSLPKVSHAQERHHTEDFLQYYDIFVRHAFGNYRDVIREVTYSPLMAESLTYLNSKAVAVLFARTKISIFPDENYSRELMQLFTIGLVKLNMDGTPVLDANKKPISTYDSDDIMTFARAWTGFERNRKRGNIEGVDNNNRIDPLRIEASSRDRFPKSDLTDSYIGDYYPLCIDLPSQPFLRIGAKYRLLGASPLPELIKDDWKPLPTAKRLQIQMNNSGLFEKLCMNSPEGSCTFPSLVTLEKNLVCTSGAVECTVDTVRVVQVEDVFYEYIRKPCVELPFFQNAQKIAGSSRNNVPMCANPALPVASEACCDGGTLAQTSCRYAGERMKHDTAQSRCASVGKAVCDYRNITLSQECPHLGYRWTSVGCKLRVKVRDDGKAAVVHDISSSTPAIVSNSTQNYFIVYWQDKKYPRPANSCGSVAGCQLFNAECICDVSVVDSPVFTRTPSGSAEILEKLRVGHAGPSMYDPTSFVTGSSNGYKYYSSDRSCCGIDTVFEVIDPNGQKKFLRNIKSTVSVAGSSFNFRNPPHFNSIIASEFSVADAQYETEAVLDHFFYHPNTPPFLAIRCIQRFGISNPSPRYILAVATAFRDGTYTHNKETFGSGNFGDLKATVAAVLLDREARSPLLDIDPSQGSMREPILKVLGFMRAMKFKSTVPLVELDLMDEKVGQMAYEQSSVFSFFRPQYSPSELSAVGLAAPEAEVMSCGRVVGLLNGLFSLIKNGLNKCNDGFGVYGECTSSYASGAITFQPSGSQNYDDMVQELVDLLTAGRVSVEKRKTITSSITFEKDPKQALQLAMQLIVSSPEFHSTNKVDVSSTPKRTTAPQGVPIQNPGYKVVIHLALVGGCDSFNVLVPSETCGPLYEEYKAMRGGIAMNKTNTLPLNENLGIVQRCDAFTVHNGLPVIQELFNEQDLLFLANTGVLTEPCTKETCKVKTVTPLFAHNTMQEEVSSLDPFNVAAGTAPLGRMADVLQANGYATGRTAVEATPSSLGGRSIISPPIVTLDEKGVSRFNENPSSPTMNKVIQELNGQLGVRSGVYGEVWSTQLRRSLDQTAELFDLLAGTPTQTVFPDKGLGKRLKLIAQLIADRKEREVNRDFFYVPFDGFDTHADVAVSLQAKFLELNEALQDFVAELKLLGVWEDVVIIQTSDFGRTLTENTSGGTDHGWGGHYWMAGGNVKGQRIVGEYPESLLSEGELSYDRGRFIPTTPWDAVFHGVADWVGVTAESELDMVLPNRRQFNNLFTANDLFVSQ